jgi:radical SAM superfamily enzyme YgiQ (UPF0313 family)
MVPMSLIYVGSLLRENGFAVKVIDYMAEKSVGIEKIQADIRAYSPDLIFISIVFPTCYNDFQITQHIRNSSDAHLSSIGLMGTLLPEECLSGSVLDSVVRGEPEKTCLELAVALRDKKGLKGIRGISFKADGKIIHSPEQSFIENLDALPFPGRDLINQSAYTLPINRRPYTFIIPSRGCTKSCIFCEVKDYYGNKLRLRSIASVMKEIGEVVSKTKITDIEILSDNFTLNRNFVVDFCNGILENGFKINWMANSRVDTVDQELLHLMKKAGCTGLALGIESFSQTILSNIKKGTTVESIKNAISWAKQEGIRVLAHMIIGLPGETKETIKESITILNRLDPDFVGFYFAIPYPNTEFYELAVRNNWLKEKRWDRFELNSCIVETSSLSRQELKKARLYCYWKFFLRLTTVKKIAREARSFRVSIDILKSLFYILKDWVF